MVAPRFERLGHASARRIIRTGWREGDDVAQNLHLAGHLGISWVVARPLHRLSNTMDVVPSIGTPCRAAIKAGGAFWPCAKTSPELDPLFAKLEHQAQAAAMRSRTPS